MTDVSISIPDDIMQRLESQWTDISQQALEALAIESYRKGILSSAEVQRMLNLPSRWDVEILLTPRAFPLHVTNGLTGQIKSC
jgi:hypothetical protein